MRFTRHQLLALILGAGMASVLPAQTRKAPARAGARGAMDSTRLATALARRAEGAGSPAALILSQRERLGLTDDQVNRLETLKAAFVANEPAPAELKLLRDQLAEASRGEANISAARAAMTKINEAQTNALVARLEARNQARAVLNADQQAQFDAAEARRPMLAPGMRGEGMAGPPDAAGAARRGGRRGAVPPPPPLPPAS